MKFPKILYPVTFVVAAYGAVVHIKDGYRGKKYQGETKLTGRTIIVTGANSGIGKATALELAKRGGRVILACRDLKSAFSVRDEIIEETYNRNVEVKHLDLASLESIAEFADDINSNENRLDVLVNNAGVMHFSNKRQLTKDGFESHLGVNYLGPFLLTNLLLPKLTQCQPSRVVNMTTVTALEKAAMNFEDLNCSQTYQAGYAYTDSKLAVMSFTHRFHKYYKDHGVTSYAVYPGVSSTRLARGLANSTASSMFQRPVRAVVTRTPTEAAQTVLYCCLEPGIEDQSGQCLKDMKPLAWKTELSEQDSLRLWRISHVWTQLDKYRKSLGITTGSNSAVK